MDMRIASRAAASAEARANSRRRGKRTNAGARDERGQALLEFAYILPIMMLLVFLGIVLGTATSNYQEMTNAVAAGAQALAVSRGQTLNPCTTVSGPFYAAAPNLNQTNLLFTITTGPAGSSTITNYLGSPNTANPSCAAASTTSAPASYLTQGATATVKVTYPCSLTPFGNNFTAFGIKFGPYNCTLTAQTAESVQ
jgi:Flp pilus assembly protein TadG